MPFNPNIGDTRSDYDMAVALGYSWVERAHSGEDVPIGERNLEQHPFTVTDDGRHVIVREVGVRHDGYSRLMRDGDRIVRRVKLLPLPAEMRS